MKYRYRWFRDASVDITDELAEWVKTRHCLAPTSIDDDEAMLSIQNSEKRENAAILGDLGKHNDIPA